MPIILAQVLRTLVMALVTGGGIAAVESFFSDSMKNIVTAIQKGTQISEQDAKDLVVNFLIDTAENTGMTFLLLKVRLPVKVADYLGIGSKTVAKKTLSPAAAKATTVLKTAAGESAIKGAIGKIVTFVGIPASLVWLVSAVANIIEPGIYKPAQTNAVYKKLGIPFQYPMTESALQPGPFDGPGFSEYARAIESQDPYAINNPGAAATFVYSRQALADLIDYVYGQEVVAGRAPTKAKLIPLLAPYIKTKGSTAGAATAIPAAPAAPASVPSVKVFTGIVSQGTLGAGLSFNARPDDLIESASELQEAATNNLAATLAALPASLVYEIKIVSSVVSKDGFTQRGTAQRVVSGYNKDGTAKYRTVVNKFAVLSVYLVNEKGTRTKVRTITLGPTDAIRFQPTSADLASVENSVKSSVHTSDVTEIQKVVTSAPLAVASLPDAPAVVVPPDPFASIKTDEVKYPDSGYRFYSLVMNGKTEYEAVPWAGNIPFQHTPISEAEYRKATGDTRDYSNSGYTFINGIPVLISSAQSADRNKQLAAMGYLKEIKVGNGVGYIPTNKAAFVSEPTSAVCSATTLYEYAQARGERLPTVAERAPDYERLGLGQAAFYTGTAEQNTKLLKALQREAGCPIQ